MKLRMMLVALLAAASSVCLTAEAQFTATQGDAGVVIKFNGKEFTRCLPLHQNTPILYPIIGPTGKPMTRPLDGGGDHVHHSSLWFTHGDVNGVDFWHLGGLIDQEVLSAEGGKQAVVKTRSIWKTDKDKSKAKELGEEMRTMTFGADDKARWIDIDLTFTAMTDVTFGRTKEGSFGVRIWPKATVKEGGTILNSEGQKNADAWSKPAAWVDYHGDHDGETLGIAILGHPSSFRFPTPWHVRTYGLFTANPFMKQELKLKSGEKFTLRHRVIFHQGDTEAADIAGRYAEYSKLKK
ncbi:MAG: PmoA family protein [Planctomycetales bacterium]